MDGGVPFQDLTEDLSFQIPPRFQTTRERLGDVSRFPWFSPAGFISPLLRLLSLIYLLELVVIGDFPTHYNDLSPYG